MPGQNIIELGFDIDKLTAEKKQVLEIITDLFDKLGKFDGAKFDPLKGGGLGEFRKSIQETGKAMGEYQATAQKYNETITDQVAKHQAAKKAVDDLGASQKENAAVADSYNTSQDRLRRQAAENKVAQEQLAKTIKDLKDSFKNADISADEYAAQLDPLLAQQLALKVANADVTKTLTVLEKQFQSTGGSTIQLENRLKELQGVYDKLSPEGRNDESGKALLKEIQDVDAAFKALKGDTGRFQDNVGNYSGAFKDAFKVLQDQLTTTKTQMTDLTNKGTQAVNKFGFDPNRYKDVSSRTGAAPGTNFIATEDLGKFDAAAAKVEVLGSNVGRLAVGFKTTRQESRAFAEAASQVGLALGLESEEFQVFDKAIGHTQNAINDIKAASKFQASDAKFIVGLASAASTLAGAFGAAQAAEGLFGDEDQDLQKQMAKFQQLLVLINGLQAVANGLQAESGGIQLLLSARTNLLNAAKATQMLLTTKAIQVIESETAATVENAEVKEAAVAVTGEVAAAEGVQTAATVANTEATVANTAAQTAAKGAGLGTIAIAAGIATVAVGAGVALALLTAKLFGYKGATGLTTDQQKELAKATGDLNEALNAQAKVLDDLDVSQKRYYTNLIQNAQDAGASQYALILAQQRYDQVQKDAAQAEVTRLGAMDAAYSKQAQRVQELTALQALANEEVKKISAIPEKEQTSTQKKALEADLKLLDVYSAQLGPEQKRFDDMRTAREKLAESTQKVTSDETRFTKLSLDDQIALTEKAEELRANLVKARNAIILSDDASTLQQRLAALKSNYAEENKISAAQAKAINDNPSNRINGLLTPQAQAQINQINEKRKENAIKSADDIEKVILQYNDRRLQALVGINKNELETDAAGQKAITENDQKDLEERLGALRASITDRAKLIAQDYQLQITLAREHGKTQEEQDKIESDRQKALVELTQTTQKEIYDIAISYGEARLKAIEELNKATDSGNNVTDTYNAQKNALDKSLSIELFSYGSYLRNRKKLDDQYAIDKADAAVKDDQDSLKRLKVFQDNELQSKMDAANLQLDAAKGEGNDDEIANAQAKVDALNKIKIKGLADIVEATKKQNADQSAADDAHNAKTKAAAAAFHAYIDELGEKSANMAVSLVDAAYENQIAKIQHTMELQDQQSQQEIAAIQRSTLSQQAQAAEVIILESQQRARDNQYRLEEKQEKIKEAKFDRDVAAAKAVWAGAMAEVAAIGEYAGTPYAFAIAATIAAITAVEVATILAKPIPTYGDGVGIPGRGRHAGGEAWVGERFKPERVTPKGGKPFIVDTPMLINLPPDSTVEPLDLSAMIMNLADIGAARGTMMINSNGQLEDNRLEAAIDRQTAKLTRAYQKSQRKILNVVHIHNETHGLSVDYINTKILGKKR